MSFDPHLDNPTSLTPDIPGVGGRLKTRPEEFFVEELPAYEPSGEGEHVYLFIEKTGISTVHLVRIVARHFGVRRMDVGVAGLKDRHAVTRQLVSVHVPGKKPEDFPPLEHEGVTVLWVDRHTNKLRRGHLTGNRFIIRVRETEPTAVVRAQRVLDVLARKGVPNRLGEQRFGLLRNNHLVGRAILARDFQQAADLLLGPSERFPEIQPEARRLYTEGKFVEAMDALPRGLHVEQKVLGALARGQGPRRALESIDNISREFYVTAFQSAIFNGLLERRIRDGALGTLVEGDLAFRHDNGSVFSVDAATAAGDDTRERLHTLAVSPSGPMWGRGMTQAAGEAGAAESAALAETGVGLEDLERYAKRHRDAYPGARRAYRVPITNIDVEGGVDEHGPYVKCRFDLPRGAFATEVMREVMKTSAVTDAEETNESE